MQVDFEFITPEKAKDYLERNTKNRAINLNHAEKLANEMANGRWVCNSATIGFGADGRLIDGQHRLTACVISGVGFSSLVVRNIVDSRAFTTIDIGKNRGAHDMATYIGDVNGQESIDIVAASRVVLAWESAANKSMFWCNTRFYDMRKEEIAEFALSKMPLILECTNFIRESFKQSGKFPRRSILAGCLYIFSGSDKDAAFSFFERLGSGAQLDASDPIFMLREALIGRGKKPGQTPQHVDTEALALMFKTWAAYRTGRKLGKLTWSCRDAKNGIRERFPELAK